MSKLWPRLLLVALVAACSSVDIQALEPTFSEHRPEPHAPAYERPDEEPPAESVEDEEHVCTSLLEAAEAIAAGERDDLPEPFEVVYTSTLDAELEGRLGHHPVGLTDGRRVTVWPDLMEDESELTFTLLHEVGHLYDNRCLTDRDRRAWAELRGLEPLGWWNPPYETSPMEDFADSFAVCLGGDPRWWTVAGEPTGQEACQVLTGSVEAER